MKMDACLSQCGSAEKKAAPERWMERVEERLREYRRLMELGLLCTSGDFFPSVHYPPITMYPQTTQEELFATYTAPEDGLIDVYAHLPFCYRHCTFCHYPVLLGEQLEQKEKYMAAFEKEMDLYLRQLQLDRFRPRTILVGGGTPSYLTPEQLNRFLTFFVRRMDMSGCRQFNYDVDAFTLTGAEGLERLRILQTHGVNRLTIGVQSFDDRVLKWMNRHHDARANREAIENCLRMGFTVNIEFIFGFLGMDYQNWTETMLEAVHSGVHEIQLYRLKVEAYGDYQGAIKQIKQKRSERAPTTEEGLVMKQMANNILNAHGYRENLRRVFSKRKTDYSVYAHDQCCELYDQVGIGLTGFSSLRDRFGLNTQSFDEYYQSIDAGRLPLNRGYIRDREQQARWSMVLPLKNRDVRKKRFRERAGMDLDELFRARIEHLKSYGLLVEDGRAVGLTDTGKFFADEVCHQFHSREYLPFPLEAYADGPLNPYREDAALC